MSKWFENGSFSYGTDRIEKGDDKYVPHVIPYVTSQEGFENWSSDMLYEGEKALRAFMEEQGKNNQWRRHRYCRTYRFGELFQIMFDRKYSHSDYRYVKQLKRLIAYYSSKVSKYCYDRETQKTKDKPTYTLSVARLEKPPYSLRLRAEWYEEQGLELCPQRMRLPKDDLEPGHARNPRTEANMQKRSKLAKEKYNEYMRKWRRDRNDRQEAQGELEQGE